MIFEVQQRSCSWCHALNEIANAGSNFCEACGHRSDLPRTACDCQTCAPRRPCACGAAINPAEVAMRPHENTGEMCLSCYARVERRQFGLEEMAR